MEYLPDSPYRYARGIPVHAADQDIYDLRDSDLYTGQPIQPLARPVETLIVHHDGLVFDSTSYRDTLAHIPLIDPDFHFLVDPAGRVFLAQDPQPESHLCFLGNFLNDRPTQDAILAFRTLVIWLSPTAVHPHSHYEHTRCPGDWAKPTDWGLIAKGS